MNRAKNAHVSGKLRWVIVALVLAGATCLAIGVGASTWWKVGDVVEVRPTGTQSCFEADACMSGDLGWLGGGELWRRAGFATWTAGMITVLAMVALGGAVAAKRRGTTLAGMTLVSAMTAAVAGAVFVWRFPGMSWPQGMAEGLPEPDASMAAGPLLYLAGAGAAAIAAMIVLRPRA